MLFDCIINMVLLTNSWTTEQAGIKSMHRYDADTSNQVCKPLWSTLEAIGPLFTNSTSSGS